MGKIMFLFENVYFFMCSWDLEKVYYNWSRSRYIVAYKWFIIFTYHISLLYLQDFLHFVRNSISPRFIFSTKTIKTCLVTHNKLWNLFPSSFTIFTMETHKKLIKKLLNFIQKKRNKTIQHLHTNQSASKHRKQKIIQHTLERNRTKTQSSHKILSSYGKQTMQSNNAPSRVNIQKHPTTQNLYESPKCVQSSYIYTSVP